MKLPEIKISVKFKNKPLEDIILNSPEKVLEIASKIFNKDTIEWTEEFIMLCLSRSNNLLGYYRVSSGGTSGTIVDPKVVFSIALNSCAQALIILHNHPSGNINPSEEDKRITKRLKDAGSILDIKVLDHLIIAPDGRYFSFNEQTSILD
ncbi:RadC DNA repair proteins [uncultured Caudovirales phage]|uniref:RadC DNA repair proteins n=1 Tax=uncultured Caudovirales phage TaxID=2100421 RepID=A0A6J7X258_9CAUD|nr:RadC DNA repair proteins [uncultured Caudovirales phage]